MGIKESNPEIMGKSVSIKRKQEKKFFHRTHSIFRRTSYDNKYSDYNLLKSLEFKSFITGTKKPDKKKIRDMTWVEYLIIHINIIKDKYHATWTNDLLKILKEKSILIPENKYFSDFFFHEHLIKTIPKIVISENDKIEKNNTNNYGDICCTLYNTELSLINNNNEYFQLDVLDNLGGSYLELNYEELLPEDPTFQYQLRRTNVKKYMQVFKEHLNNIDHPINQIICLFNKFFCKYIKDRIKDLENQLEKDIITLEKYDSLIKTFEKEITDSLQVFICRMHSAVKLFYSTTIDYIFFEEEKDDLINMITSIFFRTGNLYETIVDLYVSSFKEEYQNFHNKLVELKSVKPHKLGIEIKFCLDENTIKLQNLLRSKKIRKESKESKGSTNSNRINNDDKDNDKNEDDNINNNIKDVNLFKKPSLLQKISGKNNGKNSGKNLFTIDENEKEEENINNNINIVEGSKNKEGTGQLFYYLTEENENKNEDKNINIINSLNNLIEFNRPYRSRTRLSNSIKDDDYFIERLSFLEDSKNELYYNSLNQMRNSVNNFNNKMYLFPKLHTKLKNNITLNQNKNINNFPKVKEYEDNHLPIPYISAINLLKSIKKYKTPFEKIILIAAISDQIMENATSFWKDMEPYIEKDYLFIEADEIMSIFLYIIIQAQMPEILIYCKIINNFTTQFTKGFNISYNYTLLEASLDYINGLKDIKELYLKENGILDASRSILDISNQRISRLSIGTG